MTLASRSWALATLWLTGTLLAGTSFAQDALAPPVRGQLLDDTPTLRGSYSPSDLISKVTGGEITQWLIRRIFTPRCNVDLYQLRYTTVGGRGEATTASGALMVPWGSDAACQGPRPLVLYAHGKRNLKSFNLADISGDSNFEAILLALSLAADGYIVIAPNYAGYDTSTLPYHPFLNAYQQSAEMMDILVAGRAAIPRVHAADGGKLFVTGYSQGGYVAMATHRALQAAGIPVTASAPMSGPYALSAFADAMFMGEVGGGAVEEFVMMASSYQNSYGNLYSDPAEMFEGGYAATIGNLLPGASSGDGLVAQGFIPDNAVFDSTPPAPELAAQTPATYPKKLAAVFARGFGADNLVTNSYRMRYLEDARISPDGGYPNTSTGLPPSSPVDPLRQALKYNDLRDWSPSSPMLLCAGDEDPVVFYLNTELMEGYWAVHPPTAPVIVLDVDAPPSSGGPFKRIKEQFSDVKSLIKWSAILDGANDDGRAAMLKEYHDVLVAAFCLQATRQFFSGM